MVQGCRYNEIEGRSWYYILYEGKISKTSTLGLPNQLDKELYVDYHLPELRCTESSDEGEDGGRHSPDSIRT